MMKLPYFVRLFHGIYMASFHLSAISGCSLKSHNLIMTGVIEKIKEEKKSSMC